MRNTLAQAWIEYAKIRCPNHGPSRNIKVIPSYFIFSCPVCHAKQSFTTGDLILAKRDWKESQNAKA